MEGMGTQEEDVSSYWIIKIEGNKTGIKKRKL